MVNDFVAADRLGLFIDLVGDVLWRGSTIGDIVLDSEIGVGATWVVGRSQEDTASRLVLSDNVGGSRCRENAILSDDKLGYPVC